MWEINNGLQLIGFFRAFLLGGIFCLFYDVLRAIRTVKKATYLTVFFEDLAFFILIFPITFCYFLALTNGELRAYIFIALISGFLVSRVTVSVVILKIYIFVFKILIRVFSAIKRFVNAILMRIKTFLNAFFKIFKKICLKIKKWVKKLLKKR